MRSWEWGPHNGISALLRRVTRERAGCHSFCHVLATVKRQQPASQEKGPHQDPARPVHEAQTSSLQNRDEIDFCCLSHPVCCALLWQPELNKTRPEVPNQGVDRPVPSGRLRKDRLHTSLLACSGCHNPGCSLAWGSVTTVSASDFSGRLLCPTGVISFCVAYKKAPVIEFRVGLKDNLITRSLIQFSSARSYFFFSYVTIFRRTYFCAVLYSVSHVQLFDNTWTVAPQAPLCLGLFRQEYWSGLPFPPPGFFLTQGSNSHFLCLLHRRQILYPLSHQGSLFIWVNILLYFISFILFEKLKTMGDWGNLKIISNQYLSLAVSFLPISL